MTYLLQFTDGVLLNTEHVLLTGDAEPILISAIRKYAEWATTEDLRILLDLMVPRISRCFWMRPRVSKGETNN